MACGNNDPQQSNTQTQPPMTQWQTTNGAPPMSLATGGTNVIQSPQVQQPMDPQQMAQQAAAMPTANSVTTPTAPVSQAVQNAQDMADAMRVLKNSGVFNTPYQNAMQKHPIIMGLANAMQTFGQGLTHQPFATSNQENQTALQNTQAQDEAQLISPTNMMNMMFMKQMMGGQGGGTGTIPPKAKMPNPDDIAAARKAGATTWNDQTGEFLAPVKIGQ